MLHFIFQILDDSLSFKFESNKVKIKEDKKKKYLRKQARVECGSQTELLSSRLSKPRSASPSPDDLVTQSAAPPVLFGFGFKEPRHKRGRPRKHAPKLPLPPLYVFIRNLLHNPGYNPSVIAWVDDEGGCFKVCRVEEIGTLFEKMTKVFSVPDHSSF